LIALDTNILIYAESPDDADGRYDKAIEVIAAVSTVSGCIPLQAIGEFLNVCRRKKKLPMAAALTRAQAYADLFDTPTTTFIDIQQAGEWSEAFDLQMFDALIIAVARRAGATVLLSEDMHDGLVIDGLTILNPFDAANETLLADLLGSAP
jgi:predicted nucleic acid-binding protein